MERPFLEPSELGESDDDAVFVPIADLFSLLALTVMYAVLTFGQTVPMPTEVQHVIPANLSGSGPGKPIDPKDVYLTLQKSADAISFYLTRGGATLSTSVPLGATSPKVPERWILETLAKSPDPPVIYLYVAPTDDDIVKVLFFDTQRFLGTKFQNVQVALAPR